MSWHGEVMAVEWPLVEAGQIFNDVEHCGQSAEDDDRLSPLAEPLEKLNEELSLVALFLNELWQQAQMALQGSVGSER